MMLVTVGLRTQGAGGIHVGFLALKLLFMLSVIGTGTALLMKLIRPGQEARKLFRFLFLPFLVAGFVGIAALALHPSSLWDRMIIGTDWRTCLFRVQICPISPS